MASTNTAEESSQVQPRGLGLPGYAVETISGLTAGFLSTVTVHPLDMVKTRFQVDRTIGPRKFGAAIDLLRKVAATEGSVIKGWYRGFMPNLLGNMSGWAIYFAAYVVDSQIQSHKSDWSAVTKNSRPSSHPAPVGPLPTSPEPNTSSAHPAAAPSPLPSQTPSGSSRPGCSPHPHRPPAHISASSTASAPSSVKMDHED